MKINKLTSIFLIAGLMLAGCSKELDLKPTDVVEEDVAFNNVAALQKGLNTAYARYAAARANLNFVSSLTSDETRFGPNNGGSGQFAFRYQYNADGTSGGDVTGAFYAYYSMIDQTNRVLAKINNVPASSAVEETLKKSINGQLLALRAMGHFELLQAYAGKYNPSGLGVMVVTQSCLTCFPARNTMGETISQVEMDLTNAKNLLPAVTPATFKDSSLNQISVTGIQARVALYKGEWQNAADLATTVINSNVKTLATGNNFRGIWEDVTGNTSEVLFRVHLPLSAIVGGTWTSTNGNIIFAPSDKLTATYGTGDIRATTYIGTNGTGQRYVKKFSNSSRGGSIVDLKGMRIAEMYLIRAEARAELNDLAGAASDIATLRAARIAPSPTVSYADKATAITDILLERYRELAFEGFRFFDLKRRGLPVQRNASDVDSPLWQTLAADSHRFTYPIPQDEMQANVNMVQNPQY